MKSINEFATEYAQDKYLPVQTSQAVNAGANYVLEQVEMLLNSQRFVDNPSQELYKLIEQLKK